MVSLFDVFDSAAQAEHGPQYIEVPRWKEREQLAEEKTALGFFFSGHPFSAVKAEVSRFVRTTLAQLQPRKEPQFMAGLVLGIRVKLTGRGKVAFVTLDDGTAQQEVAVYSEVLDAERDKLREDEVLIVEGKVSKDDFAGEGKVRVSVERLLTIPEARGRFARHLRLTLSGDPAAKPGAKQAVAQRLRELLAPFSPGNCPVRIVYSNGVARCELQLGDGYRVRLEDDLLGVLGDWLGAERVRIEYS